MNCGGEEELEKYCYLGWNHRSNDVGDYSYVNGVPEPYRSMILSQETPKFLVKKPLWAASKYKKEKQGFKIVFFLPIINKNL